MPCDRYRYRFTGEEQLLFADVHRIVFPGEEFESSIELKHPLLEDLNPPPPELTSEPDSEKEV